MENQHPVGASLSGRSVLLATDGSPAATSATRMSEACAVQLQARIHALVVLDTRPAPIPPPLDLALQLADEAAGAGVHAEQEAAIRRGIAAVVGHTVNWEVRMGLGTPAAAIAHEAQRINAAMIVMGLRRHSRADRVLNDETTLNVIRTASCPVLGIAPDLQKLPQRVLVAMDFSAASYSAAVAAKALMPDGGVLTLAYVPPLATYAPDDGEWVIHSLGVEAGFERARRDLAGKGITVDHVVLHHELKRPVAELLLECADASSVDLIAAGTARLSRVDRWLLGSVSTDLVRDGRRSVLVVPPARKER